MRVEIHFDSQSHEISLEAIGGYKPFMAALIETLKTAKAAETKVVVVLAAKWFSDCYTEIPKPDVETKKRFTLDTSSVSDLLDYFLSVDIIHTPNQEFYIIKGFFGLVMKHGFMAVNHDFFRLLPIASSEAGDPNTFKSLMLQWFDSEDVDWLSDFVDWKAAIAKALRPEERLTYFTIDNRAYLFKF